MYALIWSGIKQCRTVDEEPLIPVQFKYLSQLDLQDPFLKYFRAFVFRTSPAVECKCMFYIPTKNIVTLMERADVLFTLDRMYIDSFEQFGLI
jgi:hypothetical protein